MENIVNTKSRNCLKQNLFLLSARGKVRECSQFVKIKKPIHMRDSTLLRYTKSFMINGRKKEKDYQLKSKYRLSVFFTRLGTGPGG
jgi:hypothetical protein